MRQKHEGNVYEVYRDTSALDRIQAGLYGYTQNRVREREREGGGK